MSGAGARGGAGQQTMFNNALFNSAPETQAMPQYVQQPSAEGQAVPGAIIGLNNGKLVYASPNASSGTMAPPAWAQQPAAGSGFGAGVVQRVFANRAAQNTPTQAAPQFANPLFNSTSNPYIAAPQAVMQPRGTAPGKGAK